MENECKLDIFTPFLCTTQSRDAQNGRSGPIQLVMPIILILPRGRKEIHNDFVDHPIETELGEEIFGSQYKPDEFDGKVSNSRSKNDFSVDEPEETKRFDFGDDSSRINY
jgi:hypothetical protein